MSSSIRRKNWHTTHQLHYNLQNYNTTKLIFKYFPLFTDINKGSPIEYKSGSACSTPTKDTLKSYDRNYSGPVLPPRSAMCGAPSHHYSAPLNFRKGLAAKCTWKCTAIAVIMLSVILLSALIFVAGESLCSTFLSPCYLLLLLVVCSVCRVGLAPTLI